MLCLVILQSRAAGFEFVCEKKEILSAMSRESFDDMVMLFKCSSKNKDDVVLSDVIDWDPILLLQKYSPRLNDFNEVIANKEEIKFYIKMLNQEIDFFCEKRGKKMLAYAKRRKRVVFLLEEYLKTGICRYE